MLILVPILVVIICFLAMLLFSGMGLSNWSYYLNIVSLVLMVIIIIPMLASSGLLKDFLRAFQLMRKGSSCSLTEMKKSLEAVDFVRKGIVYSGMMIVTFTVIVILRSLSELSMLGPGLAHIITTLFIVAIVELILLPMHTQIKKRLIEYAEEE